MPDIKLTMIGGNWKGEDKVQLVVDKDAPFDGQIDKFTEKMNISGDELKTKWALHPYVDGKVSPTPVSFCEGQTPASVGLVKAVNMISIKPAGGAPPPPAGTRPKTAAAATKGAPPPPPKKGSASPSKGAPPPPPKKGSASPSKGAPPPPPKKGGTTPVKSSASPPPPPKKTGAPPGFSPAGKTVQGKSAPPPQPKKTKGPPPPQATFDADMLGGDTSDDGGDSSDDGGGANRPSFNANAAGGGKFMMDAGMIGGGSDDDDDSGSGNSHDDGGAAPSGGTSMKIPMFNPNDPDEETPEPKKAAPVPPPPAKKSKQPPPAQPKRTPTSHLGAPPPQPKAGSRSASPLPQAQRAEPARQAPAPGPSKQQTHPSPVASVQEANHQPKAAAASSPDNQAVHAGVYMGGAGALSAAQVQETLYEAAKTKVELTHLAAKMDEKVGQLQKTIGEDDKERMDKMQAEMMTTVQREMSQIRESMSNNYETQRASVLKQQVELEEKRRGMMENLVERERKLHNAQTEMLTNFQHRVNAQASGGSAAIEELKMSNAALREQLSDVQRRKKLMSDNSLSQVMQLQAQIADAMAGVQRTASVANTTAVRQSASPIRERGQSMLNSGGSGPSGGNTAGGGGATILRQQELHNFLASIGLEKYVPALMVHEVDVSALTQMSDLDLEAVGITTVGARRRIQAECHRRGSGGGQAPRGMNDSSFGPPQGGGLSPNPLVASGNIGGIAPSSPLGQRQGTTNSFAGGGMMSPQQSISQFSGAGSTISGVVPYGSLSRNEQIAHHELLEDFLDSMEDDVVFDRIPSILDSFGGNLPDLYQALCYRYKVQRSPFRGPILHFLKQNPQFAHLAPAVDIICDVHRTREAEFCELLMVKHLGINKQAHVWIAYQRFDEQAHDPAFQAAKKKAAEEAKAARLRERRENGDDSDEDEEDDEEINTFATEDCPVFYYNALVNMSQWSQPKGLEAPGAIKLVHEMHYPSRVTEKEKRQWPGGGQGRTNLEPNPTSPSMARSQVHRITAAAVALLMKHEPARLAEGPALFARFKGREHHLLHNLQQLYGDHGMPGGLSIPPTPAGLN